MKNILPILLCASAAALAQTPGPTPSPDNTKRNAGEKITAENQSESAADRETTKNIRREIMKNDSLSAMAKNVKVITMDKKVTLQGPVNSEQEKATINSLAEKIAGKGNVANQLEVKK